MKQVSVGQIALNRLQHRYTVNICNETYEGKKNKDCNIDLNEANQIPIKCHTWTEAGCMAKRALVGGVSAKLTQFSWWGGGEWPDHMGSLEVDEPESRRNISFSKDNLENWERTMDMEISPVREI